MLRSALLLTAALGLTHVAASAASYTYDRIFVPGAKATRPVALSASGVVLGTYDDSKYNIHGFIYKNGEFTTIDPPGSHGTYPAAINASGEIVGNYLNSSYVQTAFTYSNGTYTDVSMPGTAGTSLRGINDDGILMGFVPTSGSALVFTEANGKFTTILSQDGPTPIAINAARSVIGYFPSHGGYRGFLYAGGTLRAIPIRDVTSAIPYGLNDANTVVGSITAKNSKTKSFVYKNGKLMAFDVPGWTGSTAVSVNNKGVVVGTVGKPGRLAGYVYNGTTFSFLSIPKSTGQHLWAINDAGQILGSFNDENDLAWDFLATPKP